MRGILCHELGHRWGPEVKVKHARITPCLRCGVVKRRTFKLWRLTDTSYTFPEMEHHS